MDLAQRIDELWEADELDAEIVEEAIAALDRGEVRVAERTDDGWVVNEWTKKAILLYFRLRKVEPMEVGGLHFLDKIPVKADYADRGVRVVPPGVARYGSFLGEGVVLMPGFVNIGAWVGPRTMVDTWATVGSCAQIGADVHLSGGVGIGGVLEPPQARPVIVEDGAFIGSRAVVVEGVDRRRGSGDRAERRALRVDPVIDVTGPEPVEHRGYVPPRAVVLPGTRPKEYPAGPLRPSVRAHRRHAQRVDRPQDVAQRRPARVRDRDVTASPRSPSSRTTSRASAFYRGTPRRRPVAEWPGGALFAVGEAKLLVHERAAQWTTVRRTRITSRWRSTISTRRARARVATARAPRRAARLPVGALAYLRDPDGRLVELAQA